MKVRYRKQHGYTLISNFQTKPFFFNAILLCNNIPIPCEQVELDRDQIDLINFFNENILNIYFPVMQFTVCFFFLTSQRYSKPLNTDLRMK